MNCSNEKYPIVGRTIMHGENLSIFFSAVLYYYSILASRINEASSCTEYFF